MPKHHNHEPRFRQNNEEEMFYLDNDSVLDSL